MSRALRTVHWRAGVRSLAPVVALVIVVACGRDAGSGGRDGNGGGATARPADVRPAPPHPARFGVGRAASAAEIAAWDIDANPAGVGLPPGRGTHAQGVTIYAQKCAMCHGPAGEGMSAGSNAYPKLIGREPRQGFPFGEDLKYVKTVGNYWPYATTLYDYLHRAMPLNAPGSLTPNELYALTAFLLAENEIIARTAVMDATTLPKVNMPARDRFVRDDRTGGPTFH